MEGTMDHWNEIFPFELPSDSSLASLLITPLADFIRLVPGLSDKIAAAFAEGVGIALSSGAIAFLVVAVPLLFLVGRRKTL